MPSSPPQPADGAAGPGPGGTAFLLAQLGAFAGRRFGERVQALGLTPAQAGLLRAVGAGPGRSQQALAAQLGLFPSRLVSLVDDLEREGLLERRRDPRDRRHHSLHLSEPGEQRLREVAGVAQAHGQDLLAGLEAQDRADLGRILGRLAAQHGLTPGVHPGYRTLDQTSTGEGTATSAPDAPAADRPTGRAGRRAGS